MTTRELNEFSPPSEDELSGLVKKIAAKSCSFGLVPASLLPRKRHAKSLLFLQNCNKITSYKLQATKCKLQVTNYKLQITNCKLQITNCKFHILQILQTKRMTICIHN